MLLEALFELSTELPIPEDVRRLERIIERHRERMLRIDPVVKAIEAVVSHFEFTIDRELDDIREQLGILERSGYDIRRENEKLGTLETEYEKVRGNIKEILDDVKTGKIHDLEQVDISVVINAWSITTEVEQLWEDVERLTRSLLRTGMLFARWMRELRET